MNWDAIGAIGELVGAVAVIATLAYLALQVRLQNKEARIAANQDLQRSIREQSDSLRDDPELVQIYIDGASHDLDSFDQVRATRLSLTYQSNLRIWEGAFYQKQAKLLDERLWPPLERVMSSIVASKAFEGWWATRRSAFSDEFADYIDDLDQAERFDAIGSPRQESDES